MPVASSNGTGTHGFRLPLASGVDRALDDAAPRELREQRFRALEHARNGRVIDATFEAMARLGMEPLPARRAADATRRKVRALEQDAPRLVADFAVFSAHDTRESHRPLPVLRVTPSSVMKSSPSPARRTTTRPPRTLSRSKA
jgi:hypothetical protein